MNLSARIALLVQAQGARRAGQDIDGTAKAVGRAGDASTRAGKAARKAHPEVAAFQKGLRGLAKAAKFGALATVGLGVAIGKHAIDEYRDAYKVGRQTNAVLKSTGGAANVTAGQIGDLANSLSLKAGVDDEAIQKGENLLLTFTKIRNESGKNNDIFNQATKVALDMSAALGTDLKGSSIQVGKALNDPIKGVTALQRVGVSFTKGQRAHIKSLVEHGRTLDAQKLILRELNTEFRGSAEAQADPLQKAQVALDNLAETIGTKLAPYVTRAALAFTGFVTGMQDGTGAGGRFVDGLRAVAAGAGTVWDAITKTVGVIKGLVDAYKRGDAGAVALTAVVAGLTAGFVAWRIAVLASAAATKISAAWTAVMTAAQTALNFAMYANPIGAVVLALIAIGAAMFVAYRKVAWFRNAVNWAWAALKTAFGWVKAHWPLLVAIIAGPVGLAAALVIKHWSTVKAAASSLYHAVAGVMRGIGNAARDAYRWVKDAFSRVVSTIKAVPGQIASAAASMWDGIKDSFRAAINWIITKWNNFSISSPGVKVKGHTVIPSATLFDTPNIPLLADGGDFRTSGFAVVGDDGPEIIQADAGARVSPLPDIPAGLALGDMLGAGGVIENHEHVHIDGREVAHTVRRHALRDLLVNSPA